MACCLVGTKPLSKQMLEHCYQTLGNNIQWNLNWNSYIFIHENAFENVFCEMAAILSPPHCVRMGGRTNQQLRQTFGNASVLAEDTQDYDKAMTGKWFSHHWPFVRGIHWWPVDSPHKGSVMWKSFDDAMTWKGFSYYWPFVRGIHWKPIDSPHKGPAMQSFDVICDVSLTKLLNKQ